MATPGHGDVGGLRQQFGRVAEVAATDHPIDALCMADVVEWIGGQHDQIGQLAGRDGIEPQLAS